MKSLRLLILFVICAAEMCGMSGAAVADDSKNPTNENKSAQQRGHERRADRKHPLAPATLPKPKQRQQVPTGRHGATAGAGNSSPQALVNPVTSGLSAKNQTARHAPFAAPRSASGLSAPASLNTPHHAANPARVGGSATPNARNSGAINGTSVKRKP